MTMPRTLSIGGANLKNQFVVTPGSSFRSTLDFHWKLAVENYCETYHLTFVHPALNSYSQLEEQFNIMDTPNYAGQGPWFMHRRSATMGGNSQIFFVYLGNRIRVLNMWRYFQMYCLACNAIIYLPLS